MTAQKKQIDKLLDMTYEEVYQLIATLTNRDCLKKNLKYKKETQDY